MTDLVVACVHNDRDFDRVLELRNAVERHLPLPYDMVCLTDQVDRCSGVEFIDIAAANLTGWWSRMMLFEPQWRFRKKIVFLDLDVEVVGDLSPLAAVPGEFSICENYNSSVMVIGALMGDMVWRGFERRREALMMQYGRYGEACLEELYPDAPFLEPKFPKDFFRNSLILWL